MKYSKFQFFAIFFLVLTFISCGQNAVWQKINQSDILTSASQNYVTVFSTSPSSSESNVQINSVITITFSDNILSSTLTDSTISVNNGLTSTSIDYNAITKTATYRPSVMLNTLTTYTVTISKEIKNPAGEGLAADYIWSFTTDSGSLPKIELYQDIFPVNISSTYNFGTILDTGSRDAIFTIKNTGTGNLKINQIILDVLSPNPLDFTTGTLLTTITSGSSATFTGWFNPNPDSTGIKNASITIDNDDPLKSSYTFNITGYAVSIPEPEIKLSRGATEFIVGSNYDFGTITVGASSLNVPFTIYNIGCTDLYLGAITLDGQYSYMYTVSSPSSSTVTPGAIATFTAQFTPDIAAMTLVKVLIVNNDNDENPFMFKFKGRGH